MAISVVHTTASNTATTTIPATTAGNCLVVCVDSFGGSTQSVTGITLGGSAGNFSQLIAVGGAASLPFSAIWADPNCAGGQTSVVISGTGLSLISGDGGVVIYEISGLASSSVLDQSSSGTTASGTTFSSGTSGTTALANEIYVGTADGSPTMAGPSSPWTNTVNGGNAAVSGYQIVSATGTATYAGTSGSGTTSAAVVTLKSQGPSVPGTVQPRATVPVPRRIPARALWRNVAGPAFVPVPPPRQQYRTPPRRTPVRTLWHGITGAAYVKVPAPRQQYRTPPRRVAARALWRGIAGQAYVAVPAPRQQYRTPPRRVLSRAWVQFKPVQTVNTLPVPGTVQPRATVPVPHRVPVRALWRGTAGAAFVAALPPSQQPRPAPRRTPARALWRGGAVPGIKGTAPAQQYRTPPRRTLTRAVWHGITGAAYVKVPAPRQQYRTPPRRVLSRAVWHGIAVTTVNTPPPRALLVALASKAGTDDYGNTYGQGVTVGPASTPQVYLAPPQVPGGAAEVQFPVPAALPLSNVPNVAGGVVLGNFAELVVSGPALAAAGQEDWVQLGLFSNDASDDGAHMDFVYVNTSGGAARQAHMTAGGFTFDQAVTFESSVTFNGPVTFNNGATITGGLTVDTINGSSDTGTGLPAGVPTGGPNSGSFAGHTHDFDGHTHAI